MTRPIKFRAWDKELEEMLSGEGMHLGSPVWGRIQDKEMEIMQFTGLTDKNGKEIYEGDIVNVYTSEDYVENPEEELEDAEWNGRNAFISQQVISWNDEGGYWLEGNDDLDYMPTLGDEGIVVEVIGNIYENPELIKQ